MLSPNTAAALLLFLGIYAAALPIQATTPGKWLDYDGDGKTDYALFRPTDGTWYLVFSSTGAAFQQQFGNNGDVAAPGDYDGDGKTDYAVFRPTDGTWYMLPTTSGALVSYQFGASGDILIPGNYDGDRKTDMALFRPSNSTWYVLPSTTGQLVP